VLYRVLQINLSLSYHHWCRLVLFNLRSRQHSCVIYCSSATFFRYCIKQHLLLYQNTIYCVICQLIIYMLCFFLLRHAICSNKWRLREKRKNHLREEQFLPFRLRSEERRVGNKCRDGGETSMKR